MSEVTVSMTFPSEKHKEHFFDWLCNQGEQDYWDAHEGTNDPIVAFDYFAGGNKFLEANRVICEAVDFNEE